MLIYKNTFDNMKTLSYNFPIEDQFYASETETIIADGITYELTFLNTCLLIIIKGRHATL